MIERFTVEEFENALPSETMAQGLQSGEFGYEIPLPHARIVIRSSIGPNGISADTGKDSIRLWVEVRMSDGKYKPLKKLDAYTTRVTGWQKRMNDKIEQLRQKGNLFTSDCPICPDCGNGWPAISQSTKNPNRPFVSCRNHNYFKWIDEIEMVVYQKPELKRNEDNELLLAPTSPPPVSGRNDSLNDLFETQAELAPQPEPTEAIAPSFQQAMIIDHDPNKPMRVLATAGSGKTRTTEWRIARLVKEGAAPGSILYVTFNKSMADAGAERIKRTLTGGGVSLEDADTYAQWFCTIHAACYRMLKADGERRNVAKGWEIKKELQEIISQLWTYDREEIPTPKSLYTAISNAKHNALIPHHLSGFNTDLDYFCNLFGEYHGERASKARFLFDQALKSQNRLTFDDMLYLCEKKLANGCNFRQRWQSQFQHVIVDEGQDTNAQAMRILTMLAEPQNRFMIVGDSDQMMYRFAGAAPEQNLLDGFSNRYPDSNLYMMDTNYRSRASIVKTADKLIRYNYANMGGSIAEAFRKLINPFSKDDDNCVHFEMYEDIHEESYEIAKSVKRMLDNGETVPGEIFIGARTRAQLGHLEPILTTLKVPFVNITGGSFWQFKHMKIVVAYLRLIADPTDKVAFRTIYNVASSSMTVPWRSHANYGKQSATRFLGKEFSKWCGGDYKKLSLMNDQYEIPQRWRDGAEDLVRFMNAISQEIEYDGIPAGVEYIIDNCLRDWLNSEDDFTQEGDGDNRKVDDLYTLYDLAKKYNDLDSLLNHIQQCLDVADSARSGNLDEYVVLSTYHRLKGLERDYVYGMGWCEGHHRKTGKPMGLLPHTYSLVPPPQEGPLDLSDQSDISDERCIAFVTLTRARKEVYLSGVEIYRQGIMRPSRFIEEMGLI